MGNVTTQGLAGAEKEGILSIKTALRAHVVGNFYPPLPVVYGDILDEAIQGLEWGTLRLNDTVVIPTDVDPRPRLAYWKTGDVWVIKVHHLLDTFKAWDFLSIGWEESGAYIDLDDGAV